jgi:hypothetical protein
MHYPYTVLEAVRKGLGRGLKRQNLKRGNMIEWKHLKTKEVESEEDFSP